MERDEILNIANNVVTGLGKNVMAKKKLKTFDENGLLVSMNYTSDPIIMERVYDDFGFRITFLEESTTACAIWFAGNIVFNTILNYDPDSYDKTSKTVSRLHEDLKWATFVPTGGYREYHFHGEWEDALKTISDNMELIKERLFKRRKETEAELQWLKDFNLEMLKFIPFKYYRRDVMYDDLREYKDKKVIIKGDLSNQDFLNVWVIEGKIGKKVFDYQAAKCINGPWIDHVRALMAAEKRKLEKKGRKYRYNPNTLEDLTEEPEIKYMKQELSAEDYLEQIKLITT